MLVFRELRRTVSSARLLEGLSFDLRQLQLALPATESQRVLERALLRAGELECGFFDHDQSSIPSLALSAGITDLMAQALLAAPSLHRRLARQAEQLCKRLSCPPTFDVSPPEGFCFYALHPLAYASAMPELRLHDQSVAVMGIRTIGTTLSAVVAAALKKGRQLSAGDVERTTVRPEGHPYDRETCFSGETRAFVRNHREKNSTFLIVDEGPGLSGSSFLSVAEALTREGIPAQKITFVTSHDINPESLVASDAAARWRKFHAISVSDYKCLPFPTSDLFPELDWRNRVFNQPEYNASPYRDSNSWPAMWSNMSSPKFFSAKSQSSACPTIFKFEGLGTYGDAVRDRARLLHDAGFGPAPTAEANGFTSNPILGGRLLSVRDLSEDLLHRMAEYLAFRSVELRVDADATNQPALEEMARFNFPQITGGELDASFSLELRHPVVADARMMPYEWIRLQDSSNRIQKLDAAAHGDNHFFPGPTDIAWDLAGVIIEWKLDLAAADYFLRAYEKISGDAALSRLSAYLTAYTAFQAGYAQMAAASVDDIAEKSRLLRDFQGYKERLLRLGAAVAVQAI